MPKSESDSPMRRKSARAKRLVNHSLLNDLPADVVTSMGEDKDVKMPPGFNPSDDSEDDYTPSVASRKGKRKDDSDIDSEEEVNDKVKKPRRKTPGRKPTKGSSVGGTPNNGGNSNKVELPVSTTKPDISKIKAEKGLEENLTCVVCKDVVKIDSNARFHYSKHYYEDNPCPFLPILKPNDLRDGKAQDEAGKVFKYTCPYPGCTKRKMGYKEICVHLATAHQHLRRLLMEDKRPGMKEVLDKLYPPEEPNIPITVKVKQEKGVAPSIPIKSVEMENSEDVDDPAEPEGISRPGHPAVQKVTAAAKPRVFPKSEVKTEGRSRAPRGDKIHNCLICNAPGKNNKEGRNLNLGSGLQNLKYHYAACIYDEGGLLDLVDHAQGKGKKISELEEYGIKYRYRCPFVDCAKNQGRIKATGYKEYAIHCAVWHHQIEKWMVADKREGIMEVYQTIVAAREEENIELDEMPDEVEVEEMHTCIICQGEDKEGRSMSFLGTKLFFLRYHYAACFYEEGIYKGRYPPGPTNTTDKGDPIDELGHDVKYNCQRGCTERKMGYKQFAIHMSIEHGGLEEVIKEDSRPEIRALADKIKKPVQ